MATENYVIEDQLDPISQIAYRYYDDRDERSVKDKIRDIEYLEKIKEEAYRDFAFYWSQADKNKNSKEYCYKLLKRAFDFEFNLEFDEKENKFKNDLMNRLSICENSSQILRRIKAHIYERFNKKDEIETTEHQVVLYVHQKRSVTDLSVKIVEKALNHEIITDDDILDEHRDKPAIWMSKSTKAGIEIAQKEIDTTPDNITSKFVLNHMLNENHFKKIIEEKAREEVEMMREKRHQERLTKR